ncbi:Protein CBG17261 [Caenorhabditis briggsae]|uniref:T-box domain-containing protein n=3 Tax=Caenorhabditis briggsae TaxID=6238 RepID=A0AAE8ZNJ7_CAEBR|nr:Protein CBG17261 [Caenorhabditis briggsae]ULT81291.1 hypothetical protein L3Y34_011282 [Caenorhabditis briggsae]ULT81292.1 hypothetical protein L3Y34_011283 [Caenorhabditis briggsae]ULT81300.1 hypothetical protein L3Y34_011287 [Caenorhabditis briggsae]ULT81301.1 hypothetical protein L3Y34_011288 [Caenorhabditis briggsae]CAP34893.1 Protein CBG17261 [Caenorhabditis briggsae]
MTSSSGIQATLHNADLWKKFNSPMEMIVTRKIGRKMFPILEYSVSGLNSTAMYEIYLHMERMDDHKYRYRNNEWENYARGDPITPVQKIKHQSGAQSGMFWMDGPISFEHIRLTTNSKAEKKDHIFLQSLHKWRPVVTVRKLENGDENPNFDEEFRIQNVWFIAVTTYQNPAIKCLKVENNKMASGFRSTGNHKNSLPTRGTKRTASETFPTPPSSTSPPSKMNSNGHFSNAHYSNQENFDFSMTGNSHQYWMNPDQNTWIYGYNMEQQMEQPVINQWNMQNFGHPTNLNYEQYGNPNNTIGPEFYHGLNNF